MQIKKNSEIQEIITRLKTGMINYMPHASYSKSDVENCLQIITNYFEQIEKSKSKESGITIIKETVIALNKLNEKVDYELIETDQREDIVELIVIGGNLKGYNDRNEDVTEDWREW